MIEVGGLRYRYNLIGLQPISYLDGFLVSYISFFPLQGTAEVVFARRADAVAAVKKYNNVQLDGKPMKIEIVGTNTPTTAAAPPVINGGQARNAVKRYILISLYQYHL